MAERVAKVRGLILATSRSRRRNKVDLIGWKVVAQKVAAVFREPKAPLLVPVKANRVADTQGNNLVTGRRIVDVEGCDGGIRLIFVADVAGRTNGGVQEAVRSKPEVLVSMVGFGRVSVKDEF